MAKVQVSGATPSKYWSRLIHTRPGFKGLGQFGGAYRAFSMRLEPTTGKAGVVSPSVSMRYKA